MQRLPLACTLTALTLVPTPAPAQTTSDPHPNVAAIMVPGPSVTRDYLVLCSGTLIHEKVFLTAGHCTSFMTALISQGFFRLDEVYICFDVVPANILPGIHPIPASWHPIASIHTHPGFVETPATNMDARANDDVGAFLLPKPLQGIPIANLPTRQIFRLPDNGQLAALDYALVGYGANLTFAPPTITPGGYKREHTPRYQTFWDDYISMLVNPRAKHSGGCYGDSGGPIFARIGGKKTIVAITYGGAKNCLGYMAGYRMDIPDAMTFVAHMLALAAK